MIAAVLRGGALCGVSALLLMPGADALALWSVVATSVAGLIAQFMRAGSERKRADQQHQFDMEDRAQLHAQTIAALAENTAIARSTVVQLEEARASVAETVTVAAAKAEMAYETANHVNEKIAQLAAVALEEARNRR